MAEHHADQDHQPIERPELSLPDVEILVIREPVGLERMQIIPLVKAVPDAVDVDQLVVQQRFAPVAGYRGAETLSNRSSATAVPSSADQSASCR